MVITGQSHPFTYLNVALRSWASRRQNLQRHTPTIRQANDTMPEAARRRLRKQVESNGDNSRTGAARKASTCPPHTGTLAASPQASSSFSTVPAEILTGVGIFPPLSGVVGLRVYDSVWQRLGLGHDGPAIRLLEALLTTRNDDLVFHVWSVLQASVFRYKTRRSAIPYFLAAVILNHARRTFWFGCPAAGFFVLPLPGEDWRLLRTRPDLFLGHVVHAVTGWSGVTAALQKRCWDGLAGGLAAFLTMDSVPHHHLQSVLRRAATRRAKDVAATLFLVWLFSCIEFAVCQASATIAIGSAVWALRAQPLLLRRVMLGPSPGSGPGTRTSGWVLLFGWSHMVVYPWRGLLPMAVRSVQPRRPGVFLSFVLAVVVMDTLLRHRSRLYLAMETSGLFVFLGFLGLSVCMIASSGRSRR